MESYLISMGMTVILNLLKDADKRRKYKNALLKVRDAISAVFPDEAKNEKS